MKNRNSQRTKHEPYSLKSAITVGLLGSLAILGVGHILEVDGAKAAATSQAISGMPNFNGNSASEFLAKSPVTKKALDEGSLVAIEVEDYPLQIDGTTIPAPNTIDSIASTITPKTGDMNAVGNALINNQNPNTTIVNPGQIFIVPSTPGAIALNKAESQQGDNLPK
jgi:hypothetical protein